MNCTNSEKTVKAFTLIEVLVVIFIISIIISGVVVNYNADSGRDREVEQIARRIKSLIGIAQEQAVFRSREYSLVVDLHEYAFMELKHAQGSQLLWSKVIDDKLLKARIIPNDIYIAIQIKSGQGNGDFDFSQSSYGPMIVFYSSYEMTPFVMNIGVEKAGPKYRLVGTSNGQLTYEEVR